VCQPPLYFSIVDSTFYILVYAFVTLTTPLSDKNVYITHSKIPGPLFSSVYPFKMFEVMTVVQK
jgi:hypothetical protein